MLETSLSFFCIIITVLLSILCYLKLQYIKLIRNSTNKIAKILEVIIDLQVRSNQLSMTFHPKDNILFKQQLNLNPDSRVSKLDIQLNKSTTQNNATNL